MGRVGKERLGRDVMEEEEKEGKEYLRGECNGKLCEGGRSE